MVCVNNVPEADQPTAAYDELEGFIHPVSTGGMFRATRTFRDEYWDRKSTVGEHESSLR